MKLMSLVYSIAVFCALQPQIILAAEESKSHDWRARSSVVDRDTYAESDTDEELVFGREIAARILGQYKVSGNEKLQKYVNLVGTTLTRNCSRPELDFHFVVIESSEINAYSTPGGYVFVTTAALSNMENEAELAGVLAHEIGHVIERHIVKELSLKGAEKSAVSSFAALIGGASKSAGIAFSQAVDKAVDIILRDGLKKEDEMQADSSAVLLCAISGYDPSGLVTFLDKVGKIKSGVGATYPVYDVRLATLQRAMSDEGIAGMKLALNTERFTKAMKTEAGPNPLDIIRKVMPGGTHDQK
ncbi:MAG TPA: M48 family metalloprotease [Dongiaceae bacterium]|nr:M48 family metalloprotease [Dongiaceae bacterium]